MPYKKDRLSLLRSDAFRSLIFVALTAALVYFTFLKKVKFNTIIPAFYCSFCCWICGQLTKGTWEARTFVTKKEDITPFNPTTADLIILNDKDPDFKVLNLTLSPLQDASTSWFHKSFGGYHGAKMRRYQELYDHCIQNEIGSLINTMQKRPVSEALDSTLATLSTLNMLNTRYIIYNTMHPARQ